MSGRDGEDRLERHANAIGSAIDREYRAEGRMYRRNGAGEREYTTYFNIVDETKSYRSPRRSYPGDAGYDLFASESIVIPPGEFVDIPTNIRIALPAAVWGRITGRSSTLRDRAILVTEGIIDSGYRGELRMGAFNLGNTVQIVGVGERISQLILHDVIATRWRKVEEELPPSERSDRGFGSTGT